MPRSHRLSLAACLALAAAAAAHPAAAQDLTYTTTTKLEMSGTLGRILSLVTDLDKPTVEKTYFQGARIRKDQEKSSSIMDWNAGTMTLLDHDKKTYTVLDFAQMLEQTAAAVEQARPEAGEMPDVEVSVSSERTGKTETIAGYAAEQVVFVIEVKPKGQGGEGDAPPTTALVTDLWLSAEFPEYRMMQQMQGEGLEALRQSGAQAMAQAMAALAGTDPTLKEGWEKNLEAMKDLQGTALRTTTHFVSVPPGATLDRQKVLDTAGERVQEGGGMGRTAANAARQALGGLAGRFGRNRQQQQPQEAAPPTQAVIMRVRSEIGDVGTGGVDPSVFQLPEGYTEKALPGRE